VISNQPINNNNNKLHCKQRQPDVTLKKKISHKQLRSVETELIPFAMLWAVKGWHQLSQHMTYVGWMTGSVNQRL